MALARAVSTNTKPNPNMPHWRCDIDGEMLSYGGLSGRTIEQARRELRFLHRADSGHRLRLMTTAEIKHARMLKNGFTEEMLAQKELERKQEREIGRFGRLTSK